MVQEQTWSNFKEEASRFGRLKKMGKDYIDALRDVWSVMMRLQMKEEAVEDRDAYTKWAKSRKETDMAYEDWFSEEPEVLEDDADMEDQFETLKLIGTKPDQLPCATQEFRTKYEAWLKENASGSSAIDCTPPTEEGTAKRTR